MRYELQSEKLIFSLDENGQNPIWSSDSLPTRSPENANFFRVFLDNGTEREIAVFSRDQQGNVKNIFANEINNNIIDFIESVLIKTVGLDRDDIIIYAPELKESIRFNINNDFQVDDKLYVIGAATGRFRGILQSMCSGIRCAMSLRR